MSEISDYTTCLHSRCHSSCTCGCDCHKVESLRAERDAALARAEAAEKEAFIARGKEKSIRELMNMYNLGGWTNSERLIEERDAALARAEAAEREAKALREYGQGLAIEKDAARAEATALRAEIILKEQLTRDEVARLRAALKEIASDDCAECSLSGIASAALGKPASRPNASWDGGCGCYSAPATCQTRRPGSPGLWCEGCAARALEGKK